jgi:hypothetical protein
MSYEVDVGGISFSVSSNCFFGSPPTFSIEIVWPQEIARGQWFSAAVQVDSDLPGRSVQLTSQSPVINNDGSQGLNVTVTNVSSIDCVNDPHSFDAVPFTINIISTPSHF